MQSRKYRGRVPSNWRVGVDEILLCDPQTCAALWFLSFSLTYFFPSFSISSLSLSFVWLSRCFLYDSVRLVHLSFGFSCDGDARRETRKGRARVVNRQGNHRFASYSFICELLTRTPRPLAQSLQQQQLRSIYQTRQYWLLLHFRFELSIEKCRKNIEKKKEKIRTTFSGLSLAKKQKNKDADMANRHSHPNDIDVEICHGLQYVHTRGTEQQNQETLTDVYYVYLAYSLGFGLHIWCLGYWQSGRFSTFSSSVRKES